MSRKIIGIMLTVDKIDKLMSEFPEDAKIYSIFDQDKPLTPLDIVSIVETDSKFWVEDEMQVNYIGGILNIYIDRKASIVLVGVEDSSELISMNYIGILSRYGVIKEYCWHLL